MEERMGLVLDVLEGRYSVAEAAERRGVSRKTAYKYLDRYFNEGVIGLQERSRKPHNSPGATTEEVRTLVIAEKNRRKHWGPKKLVDELRKRHPALTIPAPSTAGAILKAAGLVSPRRRARSPLTPPGWQSERAQANGPNQVWTIDFKGEFRLGNGELCYPLTVVDLYSRDPRLIHALPSTRGEAVRIQLAELFRRDGLPEVIRSDCGSPFASTGIGRLSRLSVWWTKLGIRPERNDPGHPEQNGAHERMHRTLKAETTRPPQFDFPSQQRVFEAFLQEYSRERPHEGISMKRPADLYEKSPRPFPDVLPEVTYPGHFEVRIVNKHGYIKWHGKTLFVSESLCGEPLGVEEVDDGLWSLYFSCILLGRFSLQHLRVQ